jgi:hypothetical protein
VFYPDQIPTAPIRWFRLWDRLGSVWHRSGASGTSAAADPASGPEAVE